MNKKPTLYLAGKGKDGPPTIDDLIALVKKLTDEKPTPAERALVEARYEKLRRKHST